MESSEQPDQLRVEAESLRFSDGAIRIAPMTNGNWAIYGLSHEPIVILDSLDENRIREISLHCTEYGRKQKARFTTAEARFYGEPEDRDFIRDLRRSNKVPTPPRQARETFEALDL